MLDIVDRGVGVAPLVFEYGLLRVVPGGVIHDNQLFFDIADQPDLAYLVQHGGDSWALVIHGHDNG